MFKTCFKHQIKLNMLFLNNLKQMFKTLFLKNVFLILFNREEGDTPVTFYTIYLVNNEYLSLKLDYIH